MEDGVRLPNELDVVVDQGDVKVSDPQIKLLSPRKQAFISKLGLSAPHLVQALGRVNFDFQSTGNLGYSAGTNSGS
jgi:hypothetical protein